MLIGAENTVRDLPHLSYVEFMLFKDLWELPPNFDFIDKS
ncbi:hypothetical protein LEP1GSC013_1820 [Leptospira interrogans serovar Valbuzzi str. Duyster]|nr:hypothetical protein LEP1GSC013_1820 [Leptospira interrogans serovar Valbuzzi str. Duyster]